MVLNEGIIQQVSSPKELYDNPANMFTAGFVGSPQMNFIKSEYIEQFNNENCILGIRPERMTTDGNIKLTVKVDVVELLGSEKIVWFYIGNNKCSAKLSSDIEIGENLELSINPNDIYKFDINSGNRIN